MHAVPISRHIARFFGALGTGAVAGWALGFLILTAGFLLGRSGSTGTEYVGYWAPFEALTLGLFFGVPLGATMAGAGYVLLLHSAEYRSAVRPTVIGTLLGGLAGALASPLHAAGLGCLGFWCAALLVWWASRRAPAI